MFLTKKAIPSSFHEKLMYKLNLNYVVGDVKPAHCMIIWVPWGREDFSFGFMYALRYFSTELVTKLINTYISKQSM